MAKKEYDNTNKGAVWANGAHLKNENAPVLRAQQDHEGQAYEIAFFLATDDEELIDLFREMVEIAEELREDGVRGPLFRTTIKPAEAREGGSKRGGGKRSSRRGSKRGPKPSRATLDAKLQEEEDDGETW